MKYRLLIRGSDEYGEYYEYNETKYRRGGSYWEKTDKPDLFRWITIYKPDRPIQKNRLGWVTDYHNQLNTNEDW